MLTATMVCGVSVMTAFGTSPLLAATYDAIAIDDNIAGARGNGDYAVGQGSTASEAQHIAMSNCTAGGNVACKIQLTYQQCGAYASSHQKAGTGVGSDMRSAIAAALSSCRDGACKLVVADCVDAPLSPPQ